MVKLLIVRHGLSLSNKEKCYAGQRDVPLDALGYKQGEAVSRYLAENYKVDAIYSSDLCRAADTVAPLSKRLLLPIVKKKELREIHLGDWEGKSFEEVKVLYPETCALLKSAKWRARYDGGESYPEAYERAKRAFLSVAEENEGKTVAVCSHGGTIRLFLAVAMGLSLEESAQAPTVSNASLSVVEIEKGAMRVQMASEDCFLQGLFEEVDADLH